MGSTVAHIVRRSTFKPQVEASHVVLNSAPFRLAVLFYLPRMLWLMMEGGLMKFFGKGTTTRIIEDPEEKRDKLVEVRRAIGTSIIYVHIHILTYLLYTFVFTYIYYV